MINWIKELWNQHKDDLDWSFLIFRMRTPIITNIDGLDLTQEDLDSINEPISFISLIINHNYDFDAEKEFGLDSQYYRVASITVSTKTKEVDSEGIIIGHYSQIKDLLKEIETYDRGELV